MRRVLGFVFLAVMEAPAVAGAQPARGRTATTSVHPFSTLVEALDAARAHLRDGHPAEAVALLDRQRPVWRRSPELAAVRGIARFAQLAPPLEPSSARALAAPVQRELDALEPVLERQAAAHADDAAATLALARLQLVRGLLEASAQSFERAAEADPRSPVPWNDRAMVLAALHRLPEAERSLERATERCGGDPEPWDNLGSVRLARGDARTAVTAFRRACELAPTVGRYRSDLGSAQLQAGQLNDAVASLAEAARIAPTDPVVVGNLGYALSLADRLDESVETLRRASALPGAGATVFDNLGLVLLRRGDRAGAREAFQRAVQLAPDDPRARTHLQGLGAP